MASSQYLASYHKIQLKRKDVRKFQGTGTTTAGISSVAGTFKNILVIP
ncbi:MAG: hypothetical protein H7Y13_02225 [Sphingobacteriaceae bacterium]|nr:hypothetical protein [Sphingobacteriaceae bacterium]